MIQGPNLIALKEWLSEELPDLLLELAPKTMLEALHRLNQITGLDLPDDTDPEVAAEKFLTRLKEMYQDE